MRENGRVLLEGTCRKGLWTHPGVWRGSGGVGARAEIEHRVYPCWLGLSEERNKGRGVLLKGTCRKGLWIHPEI